MKSYNEWLFEKIGDPIADDQGDQTQFQQNQQWQPQPTPQSTDQNTGMSREEKLAYNTNVKGQIEFVLRYLANALKANSSFRNPNIAGKVLQEILLTFNSILGNDPTKLRRIVFKIMNNLKGNPDATTPNMQQRMDVPTPQGNEDQM